jgi:hypothetical protein
MVPGRKSIGPTPGSILPAGFGGRRPPNRAERIDPGAGLIDFRPGTIDRLLRGLFQSHKSVNMWVCLPPLASTKQKARATDSNVPSQTMQLHMVFAQRAQKPCVCIKLPGRSSRNCIKHHATQLFTGGGNPESRPEHLHLDTLRVTEVVIHLRFVDTPYGQGFPGPGEPDAGPPGPHLGGRQARPGGGGANLEARMSNKPLS